MQAVIPANWALIMGLTFTICEITSLSMTTAFCSSSFPLELMVHRYKTATMRTRPYGMLDKILEIISDDFLKMVTGTRCFQNYIAHFPRFIT